ncbi:hypothetical protein Dimus_011993 [Dionaea muscipula]
MASILSISLAQTLTKLSNKSPSQRFPKALNFIHNFSQLSFHSSNSSPDGSYCNPHRLKSLTLAAAKQQSRSVKPSNKKKKKKGGGGGGGGSSASTSRVPKQLNIEDFDIEEVIDVDDGGGGEEGKLMPLPMPPAGFVVDDEGRVVMVSSKRLTTIIDPLNNLPLECVIRRVFRNSQGVECMLLCPVDMPVLILKSTNIDGWTTVSDEEEEVVLPSAAYALAKVHMHLVHSGFCYTVRGGFCYSEDCIFEFRTDEQDIDGMPKEGVEVTCFHLDGSHYMLYTPIDPLLFVAIKDQNGELRIVEDDLLDDPAIISAIDEETEFNALVEEETALLESLLGER